MILCQMRRFGGWSWWLGSLRSLMYRCGDTDAHALDHQGRVPKLKSRVQAKKLNGDRGSSGKGRRSGSSPGCTGHSGRSTSEPTVPVSSTVPGLFCRYFSSVIIISRKFQKVSPSISSGGHPHAPVVPRRPSHRWLAHRRRLLRARPQAQPLTSFWTTPSTITM